MHRFAGLSEVEDAVGVSLGHSEWHEITQDEIDAFADATHDHNWIHTDPVRAAAGPFGATIAHGMLTVSHLPKFVSEVVAVEGCRVRLNYGLDRIRFPAVTPVGSRIRGVVEILRFERVEQGARIVMRVVVEREGSDRPVCVADLISLCVE